MGNLLSSGKCQKRDGGSYRQEADKYAKLRNECFSRSQNLYQRGDRQEAKEESEKGKKFGQKMDVANKKAAELIFKEANSSLSKDKLDLHGLYVQEALMQVERRLRKDRCRRKSHLVIIVGRGSHSPDGIQKLKPTIEAWLQKQNLVYSVDKPNRGCLFVELRNKPGSSCIIC